MSFSLFLLICSIPLSYFLSLSLSSPGYDIFERNPLREVVAATAVPNPVGSMPLRQGCFYLLVFVPISCALLQLMAWSRFTLHGRRLQGIKAQRQGVEQGPFLDIKAI